VVSHPNCWGLCVFKKGFAFIGDSVTLLTYTHFAAALWFVVPEMAVTSQAALRLASRSPEVATKTSFFRFDKEIHERA
jgi:hypothetical protein